MKTEQKIWRQRAVVAAAASALIASQLVVASAASAVPPTCVGGLTPAPLSTVSCAAAGSYTLTVPTGTTSIDVDAFGAGGGAGFPQTAHIGGNAADVTGTATLPAGTAFLYVIVGAAGIGGEGSDPASGGGASAIFAEDSGHALLAKLAIAGGGGGGAYSGDGGDAGSAGTSVDSGIPGDPDQITAGHGEPGSTGGAGGIGGAGGDPNTSGAAGGSDDPTALTVAAGGAGGAFYGLPSGGSGGGGYGGGGGGGLSYLGGFTAAGGGGGSSLASSLYFDASSLSITVAPGTGGVLLSNATAGAGKSGKVTLTFHGLPVPGAPTAVSATPGNHQATVFFTAPVSDGGSAITSYTVTSAPGGLTATCPGSPCTITGLTNGTSYAFTVHATNAAGDGPESSPSNTVTPTAPPGPPVASPPGAPTAVSATAGNHQITVSFVVPTDGGSPITGYEYSVDGGRTWHHLATTIRGSRATGVITGVRNGTSYAVAVRATSALGSGARSAPVSAVPAAPGKPTGSSWFTDPLSRNQRAHLAGIPARPNTTHGRLRTTKAIYRTHAGSLAVPLPRVGSHQLSKGQAIQLTGLFRFNTATLSSAGRHSLAVLARSMRSVRSLTCEGYADYAGSRHHELTLSQRRAAAVCRVLVHEVRQVHARTVGYGPARPVMIGGTPASRVANRRVDVVITG